MSQTREITTRIYKPEVIEAEIKEHSLGRLKRNCVTVKLNSEEWNFCHEASTEYWSQSKKGSYGKGILNTNEDPARVERTGLLGEVAFAKISSLVVDATYSEGGEPHDFSGDWGSLDIKTASKLQTYKSILVYSQTESGKNIPLTSEIYVGAFISHEDIEAQKATVVIVGWCTKEAIAAKPLVKARKGWHLNKEMPYSELRDLGELLEIIKGESNVKTEKKLSGSQS